MPFRQSPVDNSRRLETGANAHPHHSSALAIPSTKAIEAWLAVTDLLLADTLRRVNENTPDA